FAVDMQLEIGTHLRVLGRHCRRVDRDVGRWCPRQMRMLVWILRGMCVALLGPEAESPEAIAAGEVWDLDPERVLALGGAPTSYGVANIVKALIALVFDDSATALSICVRTLGDAEQVMFNNWFLARACALTCAAYFMQVQAGASPGPELAAVVDRRVQTLERWAGDAPANYGHYLDFVLGLREVAEGRPERATRLLNRAWRRARQQGCRWVEGLAATQLAELVEREELDAIIDGARWRAWGAYAAWGADAKLEQLRRAHPELFHDSARRELGRHRTLGRRGRRTRATTDLRPLSEVRTPATTVGLDLEEILRS